MSAPVAPTPTDHEIPAPRRLEGPVRVNLLPESTRQRDRAARQRGLVIGAFVLLLALLGLAYWVQLNRVADAALARDEAQGRVEALSAEERGLETFAALEQRVDEANRALTTAMGDEISFSGVLQDVALVTPTDSALTALEITRVDAVAADGERTRQSVARIIASGESLLGHAPGVERLLLELDKVVSAFDVFFTNSAADPDDPEVSVFTIEVDLGAEAQTQRYLEGVPEELR
jgi:hypothetical protein